MALYTGEYKGITYEVDFYYEPDIVTNKIFDNLRFLGVLVNDEAKLKEARDIIRRYVEIAYFQCLPVDRVANSIISALDEIGALDKEVVGEGWFKFPISRIIDIVRGILRKDWDYCSCINRKDETISKINKTLEIFEKVDPQMFNLLKGVKLVFYCNPNLKEPKTDGKYIHSKKLIEIYDVLSKTKEELLNTLAHETKHIEQYLKGVVKPEYRKLLYWERPHEKEAFEYGRKIVRLAEELGLLGLVFMITVLIARARGRQGTF